MTEPDWEGLARDLFLRYCDHQSYVDGTTSWEMASDAVYKVFKPFMMAYLDD